LFLPQSDNFAGGFLFVVGATTYIGCSNNKQKSFRFAVLFAEIKNNSPISLLVLDKSLTLQSKLPIQAKMHKVMCGAGRGIASYRINKLIK
jgi:hypothetical protein